jgi:arabinose-5-phosphate isomerase
MSISERINIAEQLIDIESRSIIFLKNYLSEQFFKAIDKILECEGILYTSGVGGSGIVAMRFAHLITCCGIPSIFLHPTEGIHGHAGVFRKKDILFTISKGGMSEELFRIGKISNLKGTFTIVLTENRESSLVQMSDIAILVKSDVEEGILKYIAPVSSVVHSALCDIICAVVLKEKGIDKHYIRQIHPGGEVGKILQNE